MRLLLNIFTMNMLVVNSVHFYLSLNHVDAFKECEAKHLRTNLKSMSTSLTKPSQKIIERLRMFCVRTHIAWILFTVPVFLSQYPTSYSSSVPHSIYTWREQPRLHEVGRMTVLAHAHWCQSEETWVPSGRICLYNRRHTPICRTDTEMKRWTLKWLKEKDLKECWFMNINFFR